MLPSLSTKGPARGKHSGVISAFRQHFIKTGLLDVEYSRIYSQITDGRHIGDYDVYETIEIEDVNANLTDAQRFVDRVEIYWELMKREKFSLCENVARDGIPLAF